MLLAAACVLFGVLPFSVVAVITPVTDLLLGVSVPRQGIASFLWFVPLPDSASSYSGIVILFAVSGLAAITVLAVHRLASNKVRRAPAWDCGFPDPRPQTQYSADSLSQPLRRVFGPALFQASERVDMHSLTKSAIFFSVGHIAQVKGTQKIVDIGGLTVTTPLLGWTLVAGVVGIAGLPPTVIFMKSLNLVAALPMRCTATGSWVAFGVLLYR